MSERVFVTGNTYPVREQLKALGGRWDAQQRAWSVPRERLEEATALVASVSREFPRGELWQPCEVRNCGTEPVCLDCFRCERHCGCR